MRLRRTRHHQYKQEGACQRTCVVLGVQACVCVCVFLFFLFFLGGGVPDTVIKASRAIAGVQSGSSLSASMREDVLWQAAP